MEARGVELFALREENLEKGRFMHFLCTKCTPLGLMAEANQGSIAASTLRFKAPPAISSYALPLAHSTPVEEGRGPRRHQISR
jgi:hypothetical protein